MKYDFLEARSEKRVWILDVRFETGCETRRHTLVNNSEECPPPPLPLQDLKYKHVNHFLLQALGSAADTVGVLSITSSANKNLLIAPLVIFVVLLISGVSWEYVYRRNHFNLFKTASSELNFISVTLFEVTVFNNSAPPPSTSLNSVKFLLNLLTRVSSIKSHHDCQLKENKGLVLDTAKH